MPRSLRNLPHGSVVHCVNRGNDKRVLFERAREYEDFLEEDWFYEAITETYIPILEMLEGLERDGADWRLTMSVTPTLAAMFADPLLQYRYVRHLENLIALSGKEIERTKWQPEFNHLALMYHHLPGTVPITVQIGEKMHDIGRIETVKELYSA
jgi:predicted glycosyl hydrolase (DUF1957 family)